ncbi:hypothetical protein AAVH_27946 [Aphelenchoides avenae]|nr:hypothetical protein AAVH_27946 [Aphelenchus avenae]
MRVLSNDCLPDVLSLVDRPTLDTLLIVHRLLRNIITAKINGVCLREMVQISVERRIEYGYFSWKIEVPEESPDSQALKRFDVNFLLRDMESALSGVFKNCFVSDHVVLHNVILTPEFLEIFASLFKGVRVRGFLSLSDVSAPASVSPKQLVDAFDGVNVIVLRGQKFLQHQLSDEFLRACFDKGTGVVDLPYGRNAYLRELSTDAILDFCFDSGGVADYEMAYLRRRSVIVQGVVLPNDFVRKCVEVSAPKGAYWS